MNLIFGDCGLIDFRYFNFSNMAEVFLILLITKNNKRLHFVDGLGNMLISTDISHFDHEKKKSQSMISLIVEDESKEQQCRWRHYTQ